MDIFQNNEYQMLIMYFYGCLLFLFLMTSRLEFLYTVAGASITCIFVYISHYIRYIRQNVAEVRLSQKDFIDTMGSFLKCVENTDEIECIICMDDFQSNNKGPPYRLECLCLENVYHKECVVEWLMRQSTCPVCRVDLRTKQISD